MLVKDYTYDEVWAASKAALPYQKHVTSDEVHGVIKMSVPPSESIFSMSFASEVGVVEVEIRRVRQGVKVVAVTKMDKGDPLLGGPCESCGPMVTWEWLTAPCYCFFISVPGVNYRYDDAYSRDILAKIRKQLEQPKVPSEKAVPTQ